MPSIKIEGPEKTMPPSNGRGSLRPSGRSPPFLLIGLSVALCIIGFNYWSVSSRNSELKTQISILKREVTNEFRAAERRVEEAHLKVSQCSKEKTDKYDELNKCAMEKSEIMERVGTVQKSAEECDQSKKACEDDRAGVNERVKEIQTELEAEKEKNTQSEKKCDQNACRQHIGNIVNILTNSIGKDSVRNALAQNGVDVTSLFNDLVGSSSMQQVNLEKNRLNNQREDNNQNKFNFVPDQQQAVQEPGKQQQVLQDLQPGPETGQQQARQEPGQQQVGQEPGQQQAGQEPGQQQVGQEPGQQQARHESGQPQAGQEPGQQQARQEPGQQQAGQEPGQQQARQDLGQQQAGQEPGQQQARQEPGQQQARQEPGQQQARQEPGQQQARQEPGQQQARQEPGQQQTRQEPGQQQARQEPGKQQAAQEPGQQQTAQEQGQQQTRQEPGQPQAAQEPGQQQATQEQGQQQARQEPGKQQAAQEPGQQQAAQKPGQQQAAQEPGQQKAAQEPGQQRAGQEPAKNEAGQEKQQGLEPGQQGQGSSKLDQQIGSPKLGQNSQGLPDNLPINTPSGDVKAKHEESPVKSQTVSPEKASEQVKTTVKPESGPAEPNFGMKNQINKPIAESKDNKDLKDHELVANENMIVETLDKSPIKFIGESKTGSQEPAGQIFKPLVNKADKDYSYDMENEEPGLVNKEQKDKANIEIEDNSIDKLKNLLEEH